MVLSSFFWFARLSDSRTSGLSLICIISGLSVTCNKSGLSLTYFLHLGFLGKLKAAGLRAVVSPRELSETDALISYERISNDVKEVIEGIRASLNLRIDSGQVRVGRMRNVDKFEEKSIPENP